MCRDRENRRDIDSLVGASQMGTAKAADSLVATLLLGTDDGCGTRDSHTRAHGQSMVAARVSLVLRRCRTRPLEARRVLTDGNRSSSGRSWRGQVVGGTRLLCSSTSTSPDAAVAGAGVDADDIPSLREYIATLGVFFTLPEQGVTSPEILTRFDLCPNSHRPSDLGRGPRIFDWLGGCVACCAGRNKVSSFAASVPALR